MSDVIVAPETRDLDELAARLAGWLAGQIAGAKDIRIDNLAYPHGAGQSHETVLFDARWTEGGQAREQGCVVRIKPRSFTVFPDNLFDEQYAIMKLLADGGAVKVARPLWFEEEAGILGNPFFVMEKKLGRVPVSIPPYAKSGWLSEATPDQRRHLWDGAVRQLAAIQTVLLPMRRSWRAAAMRATGWRRNGTSTSASLPGLKGPSRSRCCVARWIGCAACGPSTSPKASCGAMRASAT